MKKNNWDRFRNRHIETITLEESLKLLDYFDRPYKTKREKVLNLRNKTMVLLMLDAGLRVGEVCKLLVTDLIYAGESVKALCVRPDIAKNKSERIIPLSSRLQFEVKGMLNSVWYASEGVLGWHAFYNTDSCKHLTTRQVERIVKKSALASFGRPIHPHVLRHTFATRLMRTTNQRVVQDMLGHKNLSTTEVYTHPDQEDKAKAIKALEGENNGNNREKS